MKAKPRSPRRPRVEGAGTRNLSPWAPKTKRGRKAHAHTGAVAVARYKTAPAPESAVLAAGPRCGAGSILGREEGALRPLQRGALSCRRKAAAAGFDKREQLLCGIGVSSVRGKARRRADQAAVRAALVAVLAGARLVPTRQVCCDVNVVLVLVARTLWSRIVVAAALLV